MVPSGTTVYWLVCFIRVSLLAYFIWLDANESHVFNLIGHWWPLNMISELHVRPLPFLDKKSIGCLQCILWQLKCEMNPRRLLDQTVWFYESLCLIGLYVSGDFLRCHCSLLIGCAWLSIIDIISFPSSCQEMQIYVVLIFPKMSWSPQKKKSI